MLFVRGGKRIQPVKGPAVRSFKNAI